MSGYRCDWCGCAISDSAEITPGLCGGCLDKRKWLRQANPAVGVTVDGRVIAKDMPHNLDCSKGGHCECDPPEEAFCGRPFADWECCTRPADHEGECA